MAKINIATLDVESLLELRSKIDAKLGEHKQTLQKQLERLGISNGASGNGRLGKRGTSLKGRKVPPKYRSKKDPKLQWAGRGATPIWMRNEMKAGKLKKEAFLIK
jgi:DNA-binding protein H-NS